MKLAKLQGGTSGDITSASCSTRRFFNLGQEINRLQVQRRRVEATLYGGIIFCFTFLFSCRVAAAPRGVPIFVGDVQVLPNELRRQHTMRDTWHLVLHRRGDAHLSYSGGRDCVSLPVEQGFPGRVIEWRLEGYRRIV